MGKDFNLRVASLSARRLFSIDLNLIDLAGLILFQWIPLWEMDYEPLIDPSEGWIPTRLAQ